MQILKKYLKYMLTQFYIVEVIQSTHFEALFTKKWVQRQEFS